LVGLRFSNQNITHLLNSLVQIVVDDLVAIPVGQFQLAPGLAEPPLHDLLSLTSPLAEPVLELLDGTRPDEDRHRAGVPLHKAQGPLHVNP
jgi:hypothetical protein